MLTIETKDKGAVKMSIDELCRIADGEKTAVKMDMTNYNTRFVDLRKDYRLCVERMEIIVARLNTLYGDICDEYDDKNPNAQWGDRQKDLPILDRIKDLEYDIKSSLYGEDNVE